MALLSAGSALKDGIRASPKILLARDVTGSVPEQCRAGSALRARLVCSRQIVRNQSVKSARRHKSKCREGRVVRVARQVNIKRRFDKYHASHAGGYVLTQYNATECERCPNGKFQSAEGRMIMACMMGQYQHEEGKASCIACIPGLFALATEH